MDFGSNYPSAAPGAYGGYVGANMATSTVPTSTVGTGIFEFVGFQQPAEL